MHARSFSSALHLHFSPSVFPPPAALLSFSHPLPTLSGGCRLIGRSLEGSLQRSRQVAGEGGHERSRALLHNVAAFEETDECDEGMRRPLAFYSIDVLAERSTRAPRLFPSQGYDEEEDARNANVHRPRRDIGVESSTTERNGPPTYLLSSTTTAARRSHSLLSATAHLLRAHESGALTIGRRTAASRRARRRASPSRPSRSR